MKNLNSECIKCGRGLYTVPVRAGKNGQKGETAYGI